MQGKLARTISDLSNQNLFPVNCVVTMGSSTNVLECAAALSGWARDKDRVVDFSIGQPSKDLLPLELLNNGMKDATRMCNAGEYDVRDMLQYGHNYGAEKLSQALAAFLTEQLHRSSSGQWPVQYGREVAVESLMITNGSSSALELCCGVLTHPGDEIFVEDPTYFLAAAVLRDHGLVLRPVATDDEGLCMNRLEEAIQQHPRAKLLYMIPAYHNPTGVSLSEERRQRLAHLADRHGLTIICDDVYQMLSLEGPAPPLIMPYYTPRAISLGSFSKIMAPGLRLGWIQAAPEMIVRLCLRGYIVSGGGLNPFTSAIVYPLLLNGDLTNHMDNARTTLQARRVALREALRETLPGCTITDSRGGYFIWVRVPGIDTSRLVESARDNFKVAYTPGERCSPSGGFRDYLRLCYAYYPEEQLVEGARRLGAALNLLPSQTSVPPVLET